MLFHIYTQLLYLAMGIFGFDVSGRQQARQRMRKLSAIVMNNGSGENSRSGNFCSTLRERRAEAWWWRAVIASWCATTVSLSGERRHNDNERRHDDYERRCDASSRVDGASNGKQRREDRRAEARGPEGRGTMMASGNSGGGNSGGGAVLATEVWWRRRRWGRYCSKLYEG